MRRSSRFLLELLAMLLIFSLCAVVCLRMLGTSWQMSRESARLTEAVYLAESAAACLQSGGYPSETPLPVPAEGYNLHMEEVSRDEGLLVERVTVTYADEVIYTLDVTCEEGVS